MKVHWNHLNIMRKILLSFFGIFSIFVSHAELKIEWLNNTYNFGTIKEADGISKGEFRFVNKGKQPIKISDIKVSCGCTEVDYPHENITKGDTAVITVSYDPENRPGKFDKGIYVCVNEEKVPHNLRITGNVIASEETLKLFYPFEFGPLHFDTLTADFGEVPKGIRRRDYVDIYNSNDRSFTVDFKSDTDALKLEIDPKLLHPGETSTLTIYLDSAMINWTGEKYFSIDVYIDNQKEGEIKVKALILPPET